MILGTEETLKVRAQYDKLKSEGRYEAIGYLLFKVIDARVTKMYEKIQSQVIEKH